MRFNRLSKGLFLLVILILLTGCGAKKEATEELISNNEKPKTATTTHTKKPSKIEYDLYSSNLYDLPLCSIVEISKMPKILKIKVDKLLEDSQGFYFLKYDGENVFIILQNPVVQTNTFQRHNLQFANIDKNGEITYHNAGFTGINGEVDFSQDIAGEEWIFDESEDIKRPLSHIVFDENNKTKFTEIWNYDDNISVKYAMKDANDKIISILKETQNGDLNLRKEHIFYDNNGKIVMSLAINYQGPNISHLTFYNSHDLVDSVSLINQYEGELKIKEFIYNENYELIKTAEALYSNETRKTIQIFDSENNQIERISS